MAERRIYILMFDDLHICTNEPLHTPKKVIPVDQQFFVTNDVAKPNKCTVHTENAIVTQ